MPVDKTSQEIAIIFTYAPAGLGHLRVTNALYRGLPVSYPTHLLGVQDQSATTLHRLMSIHPLARQLMEKSQSGVIEDVFTYTYRKFLWSHTDQLYHQLLTLIDEHVEIPQKILVVASHFGLAHQLSALKKRLYEQRQIKLLLVVQVTDDSPQQIWYVPGADLTVVPSDFTKSALERYGRLADLAPTDFTVLPYPISPLLARKLPALKIQNRMQQLTYHNDTRIHISIPISGAAVGTEFLKKLIQNLSVKSKRFFFHIISKAAPFTKEFLNQMMKLTNVRLYVSQSDREVVNLYDQTFKNNVISLEVTKPSEQAFKTLLTPKMTGGAILLFLNPVGRQEYDNLYFLRRHKLMPRENEQIQLYKQIMETAIDDGAHIKAKARHWRALPLPNDIQMATDFIYLLLKNNILLQMSKWQPPADMTFHKHEIGSNGVELFWKTVFAKFDL